LPWTQSGFVFSFVISGKVEKQPLRMLKLGRCLEEFYALVAKVGNCTGLEETKNGVLGVVMSFFLG